MSVKDRGKPSTQIVILEKMQTLQCCNDRVLDIVIWRSDVAPPTNQKRRLPAQCRAELDDPVDQSCLGLGRHENVSCCESCNLAGSCFPV
jgi:hypothetical protein